MGAIVSLAERTFGVASKLLPILYKIQRDNHEYNLTNQLIRSCTSVHANLQEGFGAGSRKDYRARFIIARKEAFETLSWLKFLAGMKYLSTTDFKHFYSEYTQAVKILQASVRTLSKNRRAIR